MARFLFFLLVLQSCSANYHLKQALKKDPRLGDSTTVLVPYYKDTTIVITIIGDTSDQSVKFKQWYKQATDSMSIAFNDSFVQVSQTIDSLGNLKTKVIRKPYKDTIQLIIHDTIRYVNAPRITVKEKGFEIKWYIWLLLAIFVAGICIKKL
tara:strand:+ start:3515 stop:3970 length:456 start_codon:yes stop_codon:yes gene_type:complete